MPCQNNSPKDSTCGEIDKAIWAQEAYVEKLKSDKQRFLDDKEALARKFEVSANQNQANILAYKATIENHMAEIAQLKAVSSDPKSPVSVVIRAENRVAMLSLEISRLNGLIKYNEEQYMLKMNEARRIRSQASKDAAGLEGTIINQEKILNELYRKRQSCT